MQATQADRWDLAMDRTALNKAQQPNKQQSIVSCAGVVRMIGWQAPGAGWHESLALCLHECGDSCGSASRVYCSHVWAVEKRGRRAWCPPALGSPTLGCVCLWCWMACPRCRTEAEP